MGKIIFLDIDGTLVGFDGVLSEKTKEALAYAKAEGHILMLCTGRTRCQIKPELLKDGFFDGMVAAAGAYIEYRGQVLYEKTIEPEALEKLVADLHRERVPQLLMAKDMLYAVEEDWEALKAAFERQVPGSSKDMEKRMGGVVILKDYAELPVVEKVVFEDAPCSFEHVRELIGADFDLVPSSFHQKVTRGGEISNAGVTKATGIEKILKHLHMNQADTIAFGDSYNDLEMLDYAAVGVAMGNAPEDVKKAADMVTDDVNEDGLYKGFVKLELI